MNIQLITAKEEQILPEVISDNLQQIVDMMRYIKNFLFLR